VSAVGAGIARPLPRRRAGPIELLAGTGHKSLGIRLFVTAFVFFLAAGALALLMRTELARPGMQLLSAGSYNELFTVHGSTMFYLFATPAALALGVYMVPLQIGAEDVSRPRLALAGWWLILAAGATMWAGFLTAGGAADSGWYAYEPLSDMLYSPKVGQDLWAVGVLLSALSSLILAGCLLATIVRRRAPGMTMLRLPVFTWSMLISCLMVLTAFPALVIAMALMYADRNWTSVFSGWGGAIDYQHLFWFYGHPVVYVVFFPFVGAVAEVIATFSRKRWFGYRPFVLSLMLFATLSMSVWGHHMFTTGTIANKYFSLTSTALLVPAGIEYFDAVGTMWGGRISLRTPMLFALGFLLTFLVGGLSGIFIGSPPLDYHVTDSYFIVAHFHYTLFGGSVFGMFAAIYYWWPKVTGTMLREGLGKLHFWLTIVGVNLTFFPMFFLGENGMPRRIADYPSSAGWTGLNEVATAGSYVLALSMLVFLANVWVSRRRRVGSGPDPWGGQTLEWCTTSPPPRYNFAALPPIRSHAPLLDVRERDRDEAAEAQA
jgi:cytochrome c oxidase subunit I